MTVTKPTSANRNRLRCVVMAAALIAPACGSDGANDAEQSTSVPESEVGTEEVEALVEEYYAAYNAGEPDRAFGMLSGVLRITTSPNLRYWSGTLSEQVDATCTPSSSNPGGIICREVYTDALHGPAGLKSESQFLYFASNGKLQQMDDPGHFWGFPGCFESRCPGPPGSMETTGGNSWGYDRFESALFAWLQTSYPDVADAIESERALSYFSSNHDAATAAMPHVEEFLVANPDWVNALPAGADLTTMTPLEAVTGHYAALNSHDPVAFAEFMGESAAEPLRWHWIMETQWLADCEPTDDPNSVVCEVEMVDKVYTKAGATFLFTVKWVLEDGRLIETLESEISSHAWAFYDFESDMSAWMSEHYPEEHEVAFEGSGIAHTEAAAEIVVDRVDEFLEASDVYPRDADARER